MNKLSSKKNYFNIFKHKFLIKYNDLSKNDYYFTFLNKKIKIDNKHLANRNLIHWCINQNLFKIKSPYVTEIFYEKKEMKVFEKLIKNSNHFIDVGSQTGIYSLAAYLSKKIKKIICIDITKEYINAIKNNIEINCYNPDKFEILNLGLGTGKICHKEWISKTVTKGHSFNDILNITGLKLSDDDCIKIDIEGWEFFLAGEIGQYFKTYKPNLLLSLHKYEIEKLSDCSVTENSIFDFLSANYKHKYVVDENSALKEIKCLSEYQFKVEKDKTIIFSNKKF